MEYEPCLRLVSLGHFLPSGRPVWGSRQWRRWAGPFNVKHFTERTFMRTRRERAACFLLQYQYLERLAGEIHPDNGE